jgi:UDP-N-acetylmuramate dehydrogenase
VGNVRELAGKIKIAGLLTADEPLSGHTSFRIGGPADLYAAPRSRAELIELYGLCLREEVPFFILGGGSNILVSDRGIRGLAIDLSLVRGIERAEDSVSALCGTPMSDVSQFALAQGLSGLEFCFSLPGSVGGAVWMNARCYERSISDVLASAEHLSEDLAVARRPMASGEWGYKLSPFQRLNGVILTACFRLTEGEPAEMEEKMKRFRADREKKGHFLHPCAGSIFKNNHAFGAPTGKLIDSLGLKGLRAGGAEIAPYHGNIIINLGGATARDVLTLIETAESEALARLGLRLEREIVLAGEW